MWIIICIICVLLSLLRYTPQTIDVEHKLKPFNPDFIPAVGDIDAFLKVKVFFRMVELKKLKSIFFCFYIHVVALNLHSSVTADTRSHLENTPLRNPSLNIPTKMRYQ